VHSECVAGGKRLKREAYRSPPSSAEVKNTWSYTSTLPIRLHGLPRIDLVKDIDLDFKSSLLTFWLLYPAIINTTQYLHLSIIYHFSLYIYI
jgi:hypothetical protein